MSFPPWGRFAGFEALAEARITCGRPATSLAFPRALLARPLVGWKTAPARSAHLAGVDPWISSGPPTGFVDSARALVGSLLTLGDFDVMTAAEAAKMSVRTLQRRLAEAGSSYSRLLEDVRFDTARHLLADPTVKLIDVAFALGYSDPAHFTRAFRRWTSVTPTEFRLLRDPDRAARSA